MTIKHESIVILNEIIDCPEGIVEFEKLPVSRRLMIMLEAEKKGVCAEPDRVFVEFRNDDEWFGNATRITCRWHDERS